MVDWRRKYKNKGLIPDNQNQNIPWNFQRDNLWINYEPSWLMKPFSLGNRTKWELLVGFSVA